MKTLNVRSINDETANEDFRYAGTYLHGELETQIGYDIFAFTEATNFEEGAHEIIIGHTKRPATFFLWKGTYCAKWRGFLVYNNDYDYKYCKEQFINKKQQI